MRHFVLGQGEVGTALAAIIGRQFEYVATWDKKDGKEFNPADLSEVDCLHVCIPWQPGFVQEVEKYQRYLPPKAIIIIHATVPVGTTRACGPRTVHSPVHGVHPNLEKGMMTFVKYIGGADSRVVNLAWTALLGCGFFVKIVSSPEASELSKLCCTLQYGLAIAACKGIKELCDHYNVPFDEVYGWNTHYNTGYAALGKPEVCRPVLKPQPGPIGGHCVIPNAKITPGWLSKFLLDANGRFIREQL